MSPAHLRRGNVPALGRLWDLIRGKRGEIPREDSGDIVKELERILENQRVLDSLTSPGELHVAVACLSASTQTDMEVAEKPATPVGRPRLVDAARQTPNYTSSSTQVDLDVAEERASAVISPRRTAVVHHHQRYLIEGETGAIHGQKRSKVPWRGKAIPVCLPPQCFWDPGPQDSSRILFRVPPPSDKYITNMELMRQRLRAQAGKGQWVRADHMEWFTDAMEECTADGREWLKACDTEDMTRETTVDENEEENGTDVESSIVLTTSFNPDLYKGVKFF
ncbi:hypothetical protein VB005_08986 [Metarhizium brunneum]